MVRSCFLFVLLSGCSTGSVGGGDDDGRWDIGDADADADTDTGTGTGTGTGPDGDVDTDGDSDSDSETGTGTGTGSGDADADADADADTDSDTGTGSAGCGPGLTDCGGDCVDLDTDTENCGRCGTECDAGDGCVDGTCECVGAGCPFCGDGVCDADEDVGSCPGDCDPLGGWTCDASWYDAADGCDCGCGVDDPDCGGVGCTGSDCCDVFDCNGCDYCWPTTGLCTEWTCDAGWYGAADGCDCGCGADDPDCGGLGCVDPGCCDVWSCDFCW